MTTRNQELYDTFQLFYDNVSSNQAPGLTEQEICMYLSDAQNELVAGFYQQFERDEAARKALVPLVRDTVITASSPSITKIADESMFFQLPKIQADDIDGTVQEHCAVLYVLYEALRKKVRNDRCPSTNDVLIQPVTHDEFHGIYRNPFRFNGRRALRLDVSDGNDSYAEVVSKVQGDYYLRYIERPTPIIFETGLFSIDGYNTEHEPVLDAMFDNALVQAAATKAYQHYKA